MKVFSFAFRIHENENVGKLFKPNLMKKLKNSKLIFDNKIYNIENDFPVMDKKIKILNFKLLLLNKIPNFLEIIEGCTLQIEYIKNNENLFSKLAIDQLPKISYENDESYLSEEIKIFGNDFVKNNKNKFFILYENKIFFQNEEFFSKKYIDIDIVERLEIYLIAIENISNLSYMFEKCSSLEEISMNENKDKNKFIEIKELKNNHIITNDKYIKEYTSNINTKEFVEENNEFAKFLDIAEDNDFPLSIASSISKRKQTDINETLRFIYLYYFDNPRLFDNLKNKDNSPHKYSIFKDISSFISLLSDKTQWNITDMDSIFSGCSKLKSIPDISEWNTKDVFSMKEMFKNCTSLESLPDISKWNTENVLSMKEMFKNCTSLISLPDLSKWNIENVTDISGMFSECNKLVSLPDISNWKTNNLEEMSKIFFGCSSLKSLPDISNWNTKNIKNLSYLFLACSSIISLPDISKWNTHSSINLSCIFFECSSLLSLPDLSKWDISNVRDMNGIFYGCSSLISVPDISKWDISLVTNISSMFEKCSSLIKLPDLSKWDISNAFSIDAMFSECTSLISIPDISNWNINEVEDMSMSSLFYKCTSILSLPDISKWNVNFVGKIPSLFTECSSLVSLPDISKWKLNEITEMNDFFYGCSSLISLPDISKWNISEVESIDGLFSGCSSLISLPDISKWNTENIKSMSKLFNECSSLVSLPDISKWNTENVTNMENIFYGCSSLISLPDLSKWDINNIKDMGNMFFGCFSLTSFPNLSKWNINVYDFKVNLKGMYTNCFSAFFMPRHSRTYKLNISRNKKNIFNNNDQRAHSFDYIFKMLVKDKGYPTFKKDYAENENKTKKEIIIEKQEKSINNLINKIIKLEEDLAEQQKLNNTILNEINDKRKLRIIKDYTILEYKEIQKSNKKEIFSLKKQLNYDSIKSSNIEQNENKNEIYINFSSFDNKEHYTFNCKKSDLVIKLEEKLCNKNIELKEYNVRFTFNGKSVKRFMTVEGNGINNGDTILFKTF